MNTFYIRHNSKLDIDPATLDHLWERRQIAVHFPNQGEQFDGNQPDNSSVNPDDYFDSGKSAMRVMYRLGAEGGYVLAEYANRAECLVGIVRPGTKIDIHFGKWGSANSRVASLKTLQLDRVKVVPPDIAARLLVGRPRQRTIVAWPNARNMIENRVEGRFEAPSLRDLSTSLQEVLCSEFLRLPGKDTGLPELAHLVLPVGRTMRDLDIYGIDTASRIIAAQVTYQPSVYCPWKVKALKKFNGQNVQLIFFCDDSETRFHEGIHYYRLEDVYSKFVRTTTGKMWLDEISR